MLLNNIESEWLIPKYPTIDFLLNNYILTDIHLKNEHNIVQIAIKLIDLVNFIIKIIIYNN